MGTRFAEAHKISFQQLTLCCGFAFQCRKANTLITCPRPISCQNIEHLNQLLLSQALDISFAFRTCKHLVGFGENLLADTRKLTTKPFSRGWPSRIEIDKSNICK